MIKKVKSLFSLIIRELFSTIILNVSPKVFCFLLNIKSFFSRMPNRFEFDAESQIFTVSENSITLTFSEQYANYYSFANGISARSDYIGKTYLLHNIAFSDGDVIIDCGANIGDLNLYFHYLGINIEYYGFEPSPNEFLHLQANVPEGNHKNIGLWSKNGVLKFYVSSEKADNSFIEPTTYTQEIQVNTFRLDSLLFNVRIKLLKLEAEGAELEVVRGAQGILRNIEWVSADLGELSGESSAVPGVVNYLLANNFELVDFGFHRTIFLFKNRLFK